MTSVEFLRSKNDYKLIKKGGFLTNIKNIKIYGIGIIFLCFLYCANYFNKKKFTFFSNTCKDIIYVFSNNNKLSKELLKEWEKCTSHINVKHKIIDLTDPKYTEWKTNFNIESSPQIIRVRADGFRILYKGKRISENIIAWVCDNK